MATFALGIALNLAGAVTCNLGTVLMKYHSMVRNGEGHNGKLGVVLYIVGSLLTFSSFSLAPQSLLAGIYASQFVSNIFISRCLLGEAITKRTVSGTLVIVAAIVMLVISSLRGDAEPPEYSVDEIWGYFVSVTHLVYLSCLLTLVTAVGTAFWFRTGVHVLFGKVKDKARRLNWELSLPRSQDSMSMLLIPLGFIVVSAAIGAQSVISGKVLSVILSAVLVDHEWYQLYQYQFFIALACWAFVAVLWVTQLTRCMALFSGSCIVAQTQVCWILGTMVSGGIVFGEFAQMQGWQMALFFWATVVLFYGVYLLSSTARPTKDSAEDDSDKSDTSEPECELHVPRDRTSSAVDPTLRAVAGDIELAAQTPLPTDVEECQSMPDPPYLRVVRWRAERAAARDALEATPAARQASSMRV